MTPQVTVGGRVVHWYRSLYWLTPDSRLHGTIVGATPDGQLRCRWDNGVEALVLPIDLLRESSAGHVDGTYVRR